MVRRVSSVTVGVLLLLVALFCASARTLIAQAGDTLLTLDYPQYRETVEPIFLTRRPGNARCVVCHSRGGGNSFLEPLAPGRDSWDEEQSLRNFERVQRLVVPGRPLESVLLVNPLTEDAGGSHWHAGGKHWESQNDPEWRALSAWVGRTTVAVDFEFYRTRVEPIFLNRRPGNARCVSVIRVVAATASSSRWHRARRATTRSSRCATSSGCNGSWLRGRRSRVSSSSIH